MCETNQGTQHESTLVPWLVPLGNQKTPEPLPKSMHVCMALNRSTSSCSKCKFIKTEDQRPAAPWSSADLLLLHYGISWIWHSSICFHIGTTSVAMWYIWESSAEFGWCWSGIQGRDKENWQGTHISLTSLVNKTKQIDFDSHLNNTLKYVSLLIVNTA